jgi:hypothetical protein
VAHIAGVEGFDAEHAEGLDALAREVVATFEKYPSPEEKS